MTTKQLDRFTVLFNMVNEVVVGVKVYRTDGEDEDGQLSYVKVGSNGNAATTTNLEEAQRVLEGYVKWDGCSDFDFYPDHGGNEHFCGKKHAVGLGKLLDFIYDEARTMMGPETVWDVEMYEGD